MTRHRHRTPLADVTVRPDGRIRVPTEALRPCEVAALAFPGPSPGHPDSPGTIRLRPCRAGEAGYRPRVQGANHAADYAVRRAFTRLGISASDVAGRYPVEVDDIDGSVVIRLRYRDSGPRSG